MENSIPATSASKVAIKWALISFLTSIVFTYLYQYLNVGLSSPVRYINYVFFIGFIFLGQKEYKDQLGGFMTFGQGFVEGLLFAVFSGILLAIFTTIYLTYLNPGIWEQSLVEQQQKLEATGKLSAEQIEASMGIVRKFGSYITFFGIIIGTPIMGAIISLIGAAIFKKEPSIFDIEQANNNFPDPVQ